MEDLYRIVGYGESESKLGNGIREIKDPHGNNHVLGENSF